LYSAIVTERGYATATCGCSLRFAVVSLSFTLTIFETPGSDIVTP
jgi:hypothetical protein